MDLIGQDHEVAATCVNAAGLGPFEGPFQIVGGHKFQPDAAHMTKIRTTRVDLVAFGHGQTSPAF
jgi:hypothetical protein